MKAWVQREGGSSKDLLKIEEVSFPEARPLDLIVQLKGVATNPVDFKKLNEEFDSPRIVGWDGSGIVHSIGEDVTKFQVGDQVFFAGDITRDGCFSEFVAIDSRVCAHKPRSLDFVTAAAIPLTGLTAFEAITEVLRVEDGRGLNILIIAGAGGVGSIAIQYAKKILNFDNVIATASREETIQFCKENGADYTINHRENLKAQLDNLGFTQGVDIIFNCSTADNNWDAIHPCIKHMGRIVMITDMKKNINIADALFTKRASVGFELMFSRLIFNDQVEKQGEILTKYSKWVDEGIIHSRVRDENRFVIGALPDALERQRSGRTIGKIVLDCESWD